MSKKSDTLKVKILELIALTGEMTADEIKGFLNSPSYAEKLMTGLKKESYIKKFKGENKSTLRLTAKGKMYLKDTLPGIFDDSLTGQKSMNRVRNDKRRTERRGKLAKMLNILYRADVKIFPDEKVILRNSSVNTRTDNTDTCRLEFYTSAEIKNFVPDYKNSIGSRALGILAAYNKLYIIYSTIDGDLFWRHDTEMNFYTTTAGTFSKILFGKNYGTYLLVLADKPQTAATLLKRYAGKHQGKIYPSDDLPNMIFALKDTNEDATLNLIFKNDDLIYRLEKLFGKEILFDKKYPFFDGIRRTKYRDENGIIQQKEIYYLFAFRFDLVRVARSIGVSIEKKYEVNIICFDYQKRYIDSFLDTLDEHITHRVKVLCSSIEDYKENYLL